MKTILLLGGYGTRMRPHTWSRPKPLLTIAGNTVLGHILDQLSPITTEELIFVVGYKGDQIKEWVQTTYPHLNSHFVVQEQALGQAHAVWLCRDFLHSGEVVLAFGDGIIGADYKNFRSDGDATFLVQELEDPRSFGVVVLNQAGFVSQFIEKPATMEHKQAVVGINWFRSATQLRQAVDIVMREGRKTKGEYFMADAYGVLLEQGAKFRTMPVEFWLDTGQPDNLLHANRRLLALDYASSDALERSFAEGFTVIPPIYLHPEADIEGAVVGPHVSIGANVVVRNSVIRNSIVESGSSITDVVLDGALIGEKARIMGRSKALFVGDNSQVEL